LRSRQIIRTWNILWKHKIWTEDKLVGYISINIWLYFKHVLKTKIGKAGRLKSDNIIRHGSYWEGSPQDRLGDVQTCEMILASAYVLHHLSAAWSQLQMIERSLRWEWVLIWCITIEYWRLSSIRIIFVNYQTSKLQYNY